MIELINNIFKIHLKKYQEEMALFYEMPLELQADTLRQILRANGYSSFGRKYGFDQINTPAEFAARVPVHSYDDLAPYIEASLLREEPALTSSRPRWVAKTAGTTSGSSKYIPITKENIHECHLKGSWFALAALHAQREDLRIFAQKNLLIGGGVYGTYPGSSVTVADISAIMIQHIPLVIRPFYIPDVRTATLPDYEAKVKQIAELGAREPSITMLGGVPTWNLTLYRRILEITGAANLLEVWPQLQAYIHGGVSFAPYRQHFASLIPSPDFIYLEVYNATEGFFAVQDKPGQDDLLLLLTNGVFFEFIPFEDFKLGNLNAYSLAGVRTDTAYVMVITTNTGLYRYLMGDLIMFSEINPYRIRIIGRTQEYINAFGEDLLLDNVENALMRTCQNSDARVRDYTIAPCYIKLEEKGRHQWFVEFEQPPADIQAFARDLDVAMQKENSNYAQKRTNDFAITALELVVVPPGFFEQWLRKKGKMGGQHKIPKLANHRRFADELLGMLASGLE